MLDPLFDEKLQNSHRTLMDYLWERYQTNVQERLDQRAEEKPGEPVATLEQALARAPATDFLKFANDHLSEVRPVNTFFLDENIGIRFNNAHEVAISPLADVRGTMQNDNSVGITQGRERREHGQMIDEAIQVARQ